MLKVLLKDNLILKLILPMFWLDAPILRARWTSAGWEFYLYRLSESAKYSEKFG